MRVAIRDASVYDCVAGCGGVIADSRFEARHRATTSVAGFECQEVVAP
jgi:hypothetical protein